MGCLNNVSSSEASVKKRMVCLNNVSSSEAIYANSSYGSAACKIQGSDCMSRLVGSSLLIN